MDYFKLKLIPVWNFWISKVGGKASAHTSVFSLYPYPYPNRYLSYFSTFSLYARGSWQENRA